MINAHSTGYYEVSLDGGKSFSRTENMLLTGFYSTLTGTLLCRVGEGTTPPSFNDAAMTSTIQSATGTLVSQVKTYDAVLDKIVITSQYEFSFAGGIEKTITEIGVVMGTTLVSRALFESEINVTLIDALLVRYTLVTRIDAAVKPVTLTLGGVDYTGTMYMCNPGEWEQSTFGSLKRATTYAVLINGTYERGADGYLTGSGTHVAGYSCVATETQGVSTKAAATTFTSGLEAADQTFNVLAISDANSATASQMVALIVFDTAVLRTIDNIINVSLTVVQVAT